MDVSQKILSDLTVYMKYAKYIPELNRRETWDEIVTRNMKMHIKKYPHIENEIREVYKMVYDKKILPSMRSMQFGGKSIEISPNRIYNCAYQPIDHIDAFGETMFLLLGGTGVGYSVQKHHVEKLPEIRKPSSARNRRYLVSDNIEGWADAIKVLMKSYFGYSSSTPIFDLSDIRPKGALLVTSGGKAPGPQPLKDCIHHIVKLLETKQDGEKLEPIEVHDIICFIADAVLAGGIRRAALISLFSADDNEMIACKSGQWWETNPQRGRANNSAVLLRHRITKEFFMDIWNRVEASGAGEPGIYLTNDKDYGTNPCCEIALRPNQFCNLCEVNVSDIESQEELNERVRAAAFVGTLQAGYTDFHYLREVWKRTTEKEALIGVSLTGIGSGRILNFDTKQAAKIVKEENARVAEMIGINKSARTTTVKPSGCRPHDALTTTNDGIYTLDELFNDHIDNKTWCDFNKNVSVIQDNKINKINKTFNNGEDEVFGIELEGQLLLESTKDHPWFINKNYKNKKYININTFVKTKNIKKGDIVDIKLGVYDKEESLSLKKINMFRFKMKHNTLREITQPEKVDEDLSWLIGYLWGDGSLSESKYRLSFVDEHIFNLEKAQRIIKEKFNLFNNIIKCKDRNAYSLSISSVELYHWLSSNDIRKYSNNGLDYIPLIIRRSSWKDIIAFIAGFSDADGCISLKSNKIHKSVIISQSGNSGFTRHLQNVALSVGIHLNHSYNIKGDSFQKEKNIILMSSTHFSLKKSMDVFDKNSEKSKRKYPDLEFGHNENGKPNQILGKVKNVKFLRNDNTYDIEIDNEHWYYAGAIKSHNTASLVLGTASGIHAWHNDYYIRRVRVGKNESIYTYLSIYHPELLEDDFFRPHDTAIISVPQKAPEGSILRTESPLHLLERIKYISQNWIKPGHSSGANTHNVSATVSLRPEEWDTVGEWMWENRNFYNGLSVLPYDTGSYKQPPFSDCTEEEFNELSLKLHNIDLSKVIEMNDNTDLRGELACSGNNCQIT